ncbi:hypothetical protein L6164_009318 [Bauhinia variegata]|uniref:Uncharacterized protein n=1 Tax=Bauhinia variegata TaxID=167791 RepID=A0ACB9PJA7_BAUVA|nr:hypothetical protein L6164_009318 [Bauhinia variegata]
MTPEVYSRAATILVVVLSVLAWFGYNYNYNHNNVGVGQYKVVPLEGAVGPESFAFDPDGEGPYTGVSDGRIIKWLPQQNRWSHFAYTSSHRDGCEGAWREHYKTEHICGRPLGLCFSQTSGDLYIADAYMGLVVVGPRGGSVTKITSQVEDSPLLFTNGLDIDQRTGLVYFTSSSSRYQRRNFISLVLSGDTSGRLMKYDPLSKQVSVVLNNLTFPNGVALSKDGDYILVAETTNCRILRYWLETPKAGTLEIFAELPGFVDNIKRSPRGGFWMAIFARREKLFQWILSNPGIRNSLLKLPLDITRAYSYLAKLKGGSGFGIRLSEHGEVLETLEGRRGNKGRSVSEVMEERDGTLWVGSVDAPFAGKYEILVA